MKLLSKRISPILKSVLLFSLLVGGSYAAVVSSDRFLIKILDRTVSFLDIQYQHRNLKALSCIYSDSFVVQFFEKSFIGELNTFLTKMPTKDEEVRTFLHGQEKTLKDIRYLFKMLRYTEDQKADVSPELTRLVRESVKENKCGMAVLYQETLKTNFISLLELEIYLRSRYGGQLKSQAKFESIKPSMELFVESLDKQFTHEYYW